MDVTWSQPTGLADPLVRGASPLRLGRPQPPATGGSAKVTLSNAQGSMEELLGIFEEDHPRSLEQRVADQVRTWRAEIESNHSFALSSMLPTDKQVEEIALLVDNAVTRLLLNAVRDLRHPQLALAGLLPFIPVS